MNVMITGASGFLGQYVTREFETNGHHVIGISRSNFPNSYTMDISDHHSVNRIVSEKAIDVIVHLAGKPIVSDCEKNPFDAFMTNGVGTASVLEAARLNNVSKVVSIETDKVYGIQYDLPTSETATLNPGGPYEYSKVLASQFAEFYRDYYGLSITSVRPANLYGTGDFSLSRLIPSALNNLKQGKGIRLYSGSLEMERDFIHVEDAARAIYLLATSTTEHSIYNLSTNNPMAIKEIADKIVGALGLYMPHDIVPKNDFNEIPKQQIDGSRFLDEFDFQYRAFEDGIVQMWRDMP
jgi:nucleoside-diphosphate-sugar epimerase